MITCENCGLRMGCKLEPERCSTVFAIEALNRGGLAAEKRRLAQARSYDRDFWERIRRRKRKR